MHPASALIARVRVLATRVRWLRVLAVVFCGLFWLAVAVSLARASSVADQLRPPREYIGQPSKAIVTTMDIAAVERFCRERAPRPGKRILACSQGRSIWLPLRGQVSEELWLALYDHENAHVLGWTHA
jgi:hypothetical protein